jgi:hypothetical protein
MQKAGRKRWQTLVLVGLVLFLGLGLLIQGVGAMLSWVVPEGMLFTHNGDQPSTGACQGSTQSTPVIMQNLFIDGRKVECGDLILFGSTLAVKGQVRGSIFAFGSNIDITGSVSGDVNLYGGTVTLQRGSLMHGNINLFSGSERQEVGSRLNGTVNVRNQHISLWLPGINGGFFFPFWSIIVWVILGLSLVSLLPEHTMFVRTTVVTKARRSLVLGLISLLLTPAIFIVLIALIIPFPLVILIAVGLIAAWALGTIAIGWLVGEYIMRAIAPRHSMRLSQVAVGLTLLVLVGALPYIGWLVSIGSGLLGLGAVFLSRFGTRLYSPPKRPLTF